MMLSVLLSRKGRLAAGVLVLLLAGGCQVLPATHQIALYQLPAASQLPPAQAGATASRGGPALLVRTPQGSGQVNSTRILVVPPGSHQISAYTGVRWQDSAPVLWRDRLARAFRADGTMGAVTVDSGLIETQYEVSGELNAFQVEHPDGQPVVHVLFQAFLIDKASGRSVASRAFEGSQAVAGKEIPQVVQAFGAVGDQLSAQIVQWALANLPAAARP